MCGNPPSESTRRDGMELALHVRPAPTPQVFELIQANLQLLSLAQSLGNSYHIPSHILFVLYLLLSRTCLILYKGLFLLQETGMLRFS